MYVLSMGSTPVSQNWFDWKKLQPIHSSTWPCPFCQLQAEEAGCLVVGLQGMPHKAQMVQESWIIINAVYKCDSCFIWIYIYTLLYVRFISYPWLYITRVYIYTYMFSCIQFSVIRPEQARGCSQDDVGFTRCQLHKPSPFFFTRHG